MYIKSSAKILIETAIPFFFIKNKHTSTFIPSYLFTNLKNDQPSLVITLCNKILKNPRAILAGFFAIKNGNSIMNMERSFDDEGFYKSYVFWTLSTKIGRKH